MDHVVESDQRMRRRTVVKGAAWAAPVITLGVAAPSLAATPPPVAPSVGQGSCKHTSGVKRYHIELIFTNNLSCDSKVKITSFVVTPNSGQSVPFSGLETDFTLEGNSSRSWVYDSEVVGNMANGTVDVTYTYTNCDGDVVDESQSINVSSLPPCSFGYPDHGSSAEKASEKSEGSSTSSSTATDSGSRTSTTDQSSQAATSGAKTSPAPEAEAPAGAQTPAPASTAAPTSAE